MPSKAPARAPQKATKKYPKKNPTGKHANPELKERRLYRTLCAQIDGGHFKNALKTCDALLRLKESDADALRTKLFLLLQTEQYDPALALAQSAASASAYAFERAYALYGLRKETSASEEVTEIKDSAASGQLSRGVPILEAQLNYRQHDYQEAFDKYSHLLDTCSNAEEHADLSTNLDACQTHLEFVANGYLHALDGLPPLIVNGIEENPPPIPPSMGALASSARFQASQDAPTKAPVKKSVRLSRVPKGVTPGVTPPPDPERWIKKSERSNYQQAHGKRKKQGGGATQGVSAEPASGQGGKSGKGKKR